MVSTTRNKPQLPPNSIFKTPTSPTSQTDKKRPIDVVPDILKDKYVDPNERFRRTLEWRGDKQLALPADPRESTKVPNVPLPAPGTADPAQDFVRRAALTLGFSPEVVNEAVAEMARRDGNQLVVDKDTGKALTTVEELQAADNDSDGTDAYTFDASQIALLRDVNDVRKLGFKTLDELYAYQASQFQSLMDAGISGTAVDVEKYVKGINDPNVRDAMIRTYEAMRGLDDLAHAKEGSIEQLGALKEMLAESAAKLPKGHPLGAMVAEAQKRIDAAEKSMLAGAGGAGGLGGLGGLYSRETVAALTNLGQDTLGKMPDESMMFGVAEQLASQAKTKGASDAQADALRRAVEIAYTIRSGQVTSADGLKRANADLQSALDGAGKFAPKELRALLNQAATKGTVTKLDEIEPNKTEQQKAADVVSTLAGMFKDAAAGSGKLDDVAETFDALKNAIEAAQKGGTWDGILAGGTSAVAIVKGMAALLERLPHLAPQAAELLKKLGAVAKLPADALGAVTNGYKAISGRDFSGNELSTNDRIKAAVDLGLDNAPSLVSGIGTLAGSTTLAAIGAPAAIIYGEVKLMMMVLEEVGKAKSAMYEGEMRDRFDIPKGESFNSGLNRVAQRVASGDTSRFTSATLTAQRLLQSGFSDVDTHARFLAYVSQRLGRGNVDALMRGRPIPGPWNDPGPNTPDPRREIKTVELAKDLQRLVGEFLQRERSEVVNQLNNRAGAQRGGYLDPRERANRFPR